MNVVCRAGRRRRTRSSTAPLARLAALRADAACRSTDPDPLGGYEIASVLPPEEYERAVGRGARARCAHGEVDKVVLAREVRVAARRAVQRRRPCSTRCAPAIRAATASASERPRPRSSARAPSCSCAARARVVSTVALAGSTRRSADPAVDDHLGERLLHSAKDLDEHAIVVAHDRALARAAVGLGGGRRGARAGQGRQHPAPRDAGAGAARRAAAARSSWPARCTRRPPSAASRGARARALVRSSSSSTAAGTRGRSAGWTPPRTASSASRCAARCSQGRTAHCYAGVGVVADSDPEAELAETEVKLQAMVPALTGL